MDRTNRTMRDALIGLTDKLRKHHRTCQAEKQWSGARRLAYNNARGVIAMKRWLCAVTLGLAPLVLGPGGSKLTRAAAQSKASPGGAPARAPITIEQVAKEAASRKRWEFLTTVQFTRIPVGTATPFNARATF